MAHSEKKGSTTASAQLDKDRPPEIVVKVSWCKGCGLCVEYCNREVLEMDDVLPVVVDPEKCTRCLQCEVICPDFAIEVRDNRVDVVEKTGDEGS